AAGLGDVAKDAMEHLRVIMNDSVAIAKLEVRRVTHHVEETGREFLPRIGVGAVAAVAALAGIVLALVALFIALEDVIPSVAVRLAIFAAAFLIFAAACGFYAARPRKHPPSEALVAIPPPSPSPRRS